MKKILSIFALLMTIVTGAWAATDGYTTDAIKLTSGGSHSNLESTNKNFKLSASTVGSSSNGMRIAAPNAFTITAESGITIDAITLVTNQGGRNFTSNPEVEAAKQGTSGDAAKTYDYTFTTSPTAVTFTNANGTSSNNIDVISISITYTSGGGGGDTTAPTLSSSNPADGATGVATSGNIVLTFDENVACTTAATLTPEGGVAINLGAPTVSGTTVTYAYSGLDLNKAHTFNLAANSVADGSDNKYASAINFSFTTTATAAVTIGLTQTITDAGEPHTIGAATYTGTDHVTVAKSIGSSCGDGWTGKTIKVGNPEVTYNATEAFRKTVRGTVFVDAQYVGYTMTVASGYKVSLSNLNAEFWSSDATMTWKVVVLNPSGTAIYESSTAQNNSDNKGTITVASPTGLTDLVAGTYTIKLMMYQDGGNKYFAVPSLTFDAAVEEDTTPTCTITASVADGQSEWGSIDKAGENEVIEGGNLVLTATANAGYNFINWTKGGVVYATTASISLENITADATYVANFDQATRIKYPSTDAGTYGKMGTNYSPANGVNEKWADKDNKFTIPSYMHKYFYREGYRFNNWAVQNDGTTNRYNSGDEVTILPAAISSNQATINPSFVATTKTVADAVEATDVIWSFAKSDMVFVDWQCSDENKYEYYTTTATIAGEQIDVPMKITKGKVANYTRSDDMAQTNQNTKFIVPAVKGMVVSIPNAYVAFSTTTVAGSTDYTKSSDGKSLTYTYNGEESEIAIVIGENNQYLKTIKVTYPRATETITPAADKTYTTFSCTKALDFSAVEGLEAYAAVSAGGGKVRMTKVTDIPANTGLVLKKTGTDDSYNVPVGAATSLGVDNKLVAATTATAVEAYDADNNVFNYILKNGEFHPATAGTLAAGKAYLHLEASAGQQGLVMDFDDAPTAVEAVAEAKVNVNVPVKVIKNGQLFIGNYTVAGARVK